MPNFFTAVKKWFTCSSGSDAIEEEQSEGQNAHSDTSSFASYDPRLNQVKVLFYVQGMLAWTNNSLILYEDHIEWGFPSGRPDFLIEDIEIDSIKIGPEDNADTPFMSRNIALGPASMNLKLLSFTVKPCATPIILVFMCIQNLIDFLHFLKRTRDIAGFFPRSELSRSHYHKLLRLLARNS